MNSIYMSQTKKSNDGPYSKIQIQHEYMPYGKVLIVDDMSTNLYVATDLLLPYGLEIDTAASGFETIEKVGNGAVYDVIFMDHMMPLMDGVETTRNLRAMEYSGTIIMLSSNTQLENEMMFKQHGFDDFVSKPIDLRHINNILNKYIRDKHFQKNTRHLTNSNNTTQLYRNSVPEYVERFRRDAKKALTVLSESIKNNDIMQLITTFHALKSQLAIIGENNLSKMAYGLEVAGLNNDWSFIYANFGQFTVILKILIEQLEPNPEVA